MATKTVELSIDFPRLSRTDLFALLSKHDKLARVLGVPMKTIVKGTDPSEPDGVGSVRAIRVGPVYFEETVTGFEKDRTIKYRISKGGFMKHHDAVMRFSERDGAAHLDHTIEIESSIPGATGVIAAGLGVVMRSAYNRLAKK